MNEERTHNFSDREKEFVEVLFRTGTKRNVALILVFLANDSEVTSRSIERGSDLSKPEICVAMKYLEDQGWVKEQEKPSGNGGRPHKVYCLALPIAKITACIEEEKKAETIKQIALISRLREFVH